MHWLIPAPTRSGKGNLVNTLCLEWIESGHWISYYAPHADIAEKLIAVLFYKLGPAMFKRPILIERLSDTDRVIMRNYVRRSMKTGFDAMRENEQFASAFVEMLAHQRRKSDLIENPVLNTYSFLLARVYQEQDEWCPEWWLKHALDSRHPIHRHLVKHCRDEHIRHELEGVRFFPQREKIQMLYAVTRLYEAVYGKAPVLARTSKPATVDWVTFKNAGGIHFMLGGDVAPEVLRLAIRSDFQETIFNGHRLMREGYCIFDEILNYGGFWGEFESHALSTCGHHGIHLVGQTQSLNFPTPEIRENVMSNTNRFWLSQSDFELSKIGALDLLGMLSRDKVHHVDTVKRQVNKGFREITHVVKGISKGEHGESESEREQINLVPILEIETDEKPVYEDVNAQVMWKAQELMGLPIGETIVREMRKKPYKIHVTLMKDSWPFGMAAKKVKECCELIKLKNEYDTPEIRYPENPTTPLQRNATRRRGNG